MSDKKTDEQKLAALIEALGESVLEASDEEIVEELRLAGIDPDAEAARLKARMLATVRSFRQRALDAARTGYASRLERFGAKVIYHPQDSGSAPQAVFIRHSATAIRAICHRSVPGPRKSHRQ